MNKFTNHICADKLSSCYTERHHNCEYLSHQKPPKLAQDFYAE